MIVKNITYLLFTIGMLLAYYGFKLAAQSYSAAPLIQDDGYTVTGGFLLLLSGLIFGYLISEKIHAAKGKKK